MTEREKLILIVDDEPANRKLFRDVLKHHGYATLEAEDGRQGVEMALNFRPDLILMDLNLPVMSGIEATRTILSNQVAEHIPIIALTASVMPADETRMREAGCLGYLAKPINIRDLLNKVAGYLGEKSL